MIEDCRYKINKHNRTDRIPNTKCKKTKGFVCKCVGESDCDYVKNQNRIIREQSR